MTVYENGEGYKDHTAGKAICRADRERKKKMSEWKMEYIKELTGEQVETIRRGRLRKAKEVIGQQENRKLTGVGDTCVRFEEKPVKNGLYRSGNGEVEVFYVVVYVLETDLALCYSIY